ncbi:regulatory protein recx [hydrocarbon metagenome]|uniref:Regulatory protein RecX n=1 Tax=hydrocarbon metagenome TaxID=938273 RepID=A0A0W8FZ83_9ZZZZ
MRILSLVKKNNYVTVTFDNDEKLRLHYEVAVKCGLRKNDELSEEEIKSIQKTEEKFNLKNSALRLISRRPHSSFELRVKLQKKNFNKDGISEIIKDFLAKGYLSDNDFAERFIDEGIKKKKGLMKIKAELFSKGVSREIVDSVLLKFDDVPLLSSNAKLLALKKINSLNHKELAPQQIKQKLYSYLGGKGYSSEIIREVIEELVQEE